MRAHKLIFPRASRLLKDIGEEGFDRLCACMHVRELHLKNKEPFLHEEDPCNKIGIVVMGAVRISRMRVDGVRCVMEVVEEGDVFGSTYAFRDGNNDGITACSVGESTVLLFDTANITRPCHKVCSAHLQFIRNLLAVISQKTYRMKHKLRILSHRTIRGRLMLFLQICAHKSRSKSFDIAFDRQALSDYLCVDRSALSAELSKMRSEGIIEFEKNHFVLKHTEKLF